MVQIKIVNTISFVLDYFVFVIGLWYDTKISSLKIIGLN